ncbi:hotdog family protein [Cohnella faecalis]|uniref:hypothetical protein n=1 Tax=Cohnella faecalis TaxID=2315694 RepID=UPI0011C21A54|nr:hypothetical protein [Cohnella faecalis]
MAGCGRPPAVAVRGSGRRPIRSGTPLPGYSRSSASTAHELAAGDDPYRSGRLFHGPAFWIAKEWTLGTNGASSILAADGGAGGTAIPTGCLNPLLLDGATHAIPHDELTLWSDAVAKDTVGYPHRLTSCRFYGKTPASGEVRCEVRFDGFEEEKNVTRRSGSVSMSKKSCGPSFGLSRC